MLHEILGYYTLEVNLRSGLDVMPSMTWGGGGHEAEGGGAEPISVNQRQRKLYWGGGGKSGMMFCAQF